MSTANSKLKIDYGFDSFGTSNVHGDLKVTGGLQVDGILVYAGTASGDFLPDTDGRLMGNTTLRWNFNGRSANIANNLSVSGSTTLNSTLTVNGVTNSVNTTITGFANVSTSVNSALLTVGTDFIANTTGVYHTGLVNAASFTTSGILANTTAIIPTSNTILLGNSTSRFVISANTGDFSGNILTSGSILPTSNTILLGNSTNRFVISANNINLSGSIDSSVGATFSGQVNSSTGFGAGTINSTSNGIFANSTNISLGNSSVNVNITTAGITSSGGSGVNPFSNTLGTTLGTSTQRWLLTANTGNFSGDLAVTGNTTLSGNATLSGTLQTISGNVIFDTNVLVVDSVDNRVGILTLTPSVALDVVGSANVSTSVNSALLTVGTSFIANTTGVYHTGLVNAASHIVGSNFIANSSAIVGTGFANISTSVNSALLTVGTDFIANTTGAYHTGLVNAASFRTSGFIANTTAIVPTSNTILLGNSIGRFVISANTGNFSGLITGTSGLDITGLVNASSGFGTSTINSTSNGFFTNSISLSLGNTSSNVAITPSTIQVGTSFIANTTGAYHTGLVNAALLSVGTNFIANSSAIVGTGFANVSTSVNSALLTVGTNFIANTTGAYHTGLVNSALLTVGTNFIANTTGAYHTGLVNAASHTVGTDFIANTSGVYHTGIVNAASHTVGTSFIANSTIVVLGSGVRLLANGQTGNLNDVLLSNGAVGSPYWGSLSGVNVSDDGSTNSTRYLLFANQTSGSLVNGYVSSTKLTFNPSSGSLTVTEVNTTSDVRSKTNIETILNPVEVISKLRGVSFHRNETGIRSYGVIAQEIEEVLPDIVFNDKEGMKSVAYNGIIGFLIEAIKHQQTQIDSLLINGSKNGNQS
jgi:hypothetical protein